MNVKDWFNKAQAENFAIGALRLCSGHAIAQRTEDNQP